MPFPTVSWFKDNKSLTNSSHYKFNKNEQILIIEKIKGKDEGSYMCKACNLVGCINHTTILVLGEAFNYYF